MRVGHASPARMDVDELWERFFGSGSNPVRSAGFEVPTDVLHLEDSLIVRMDLPGVDPEAVEVTVQENTLLVNGARPFPFDSNEVRFVRRGAFYGDFTQRISLGKGLNVDDIEARFDKGVLQIKIPYADEVQPRKIAIQSDTPAALGS